MCLIHVWEKAFTGDILLPGVSGTGAAGGTSGTVASHLSWKKTSSGRPAMKWKPIVEEAQAGLRPWDKLEGRSPQQVGQGHLAALEYVPRSTTRKNQVQFSPEAESSEKAVDQWTGEKNKITLPSFFESLYNSS